MAGFYITKTATIELTQPQLVTLLEELRLWDEDKYVGEILIRDLREIQRRVIGLLEENRPFLGSQTQPLLRILLCLLQNAAEMQKPVYWR
jgi:hypothetical protein